MLARRGGEGADVVGPQRKRDESPELAAEVLAAGHVVVQQARDGNGFEVALVPNPSWREDLARERLELTAQPGGGRDREPALTRADDLARDERLGGSAEQTLLGQAPDLELRRKGERQVGHLRIEVRDAGLEAVEHADAIGLHEEVVGQVDANIDVLEPGEQGCVARLGEAGPPRRQGIRGPISPGLSQQLVALFGGEDLLPAMMALEWRQRGGAGEPLRSVFE